MAKISGEYGGGHQLPRNGFPDIGHKRQGIDKKKKALYEIIIRKIISGDGICRLFLRIRGNSAGKSES